MSMSIDALPRLSTISTTDVQTRHSTDTLRGCSPLSNPLLCWTNLQLCNVTSQPNRKAFWQQKPPHRLRVGATSFACHAQSKNNRGCMPSHSVLFGPWWWQTPNKLGLCSQNPTKMKITCIPFLLIPKQYYQNNSTQDHHIRTAIRH